MSEEVNLIASPQMQDFPLLPTFNTKFNNMIEWYYFDSYFNEEEIKQIEKTLRSTPYEEATVEGGNEEYRKSSIKWIMPFQENRWLFDRLMNCITEANNELWNFDLQSVRDNIQYTEYRSEDKGFYDWHMDIGSGLLSTRKVSLTVQLSDPSDYEGGELELKIGNSSIKPPNAKGTVIIFPSYFLHRVTPVTKGLRKSMVLWTGGSSYK